MIIFNLWAMIVVGVIVIAGLAINSVAPSAFIDPYQKWTIGILATVIGGAAEIIGLRGRLFFIPIWLIGIGILGYSGYAHWGIAGVIVPLAAVVLAIWWMIKSAAKRE